jgi:hypothetical protein
MILFPKTAMIYVCVWSLRAVNAPTLIATNYKHTRKVQFICGFLSIQTSLLKSLSE